MFIYLYYSIIYVCFRNQDDNSAVWKHCSTSYSMTLSIFTLNQISRIIYLKEALWCPPPPPPGSETTAHRNETCCQPSETPNLTRCVPKRNAPRTKIRRAAHRTETRCASKWNTLRTLKSHKLKHAAHGKRNAPPTLRNPTNRTCCAESETNHTTHP